MGESVQEFVFFKKFSDCSNSEERLLPSPDSVIGLGAEAMVIGPLPIIDCQDFCDTQGDPCTDEIGEQWLSSAKVCHWDNPSKQKAHGIATGRDEHRPDAAPQLARSCELIERA